MDPLSSFRDDLHRWSSHWQAQVLAAHAPLFDGKPAPIGFEFGPGWYGIVDDLLSGLENLLTGEMLPYFGITQVKEKYGTLRVYYSVEGRIQMTIDIVTPGGVASFREKSKSRVLPIHQIDALIAEADSASAKTCYFCGAAGALGCHGSGWIHVSCPECVKLRRPAAS